jgi:predicted metal-dependent hydrolase
MNDKPSEPALDSRSCEEIRKGVEEFNCGRFFECHDTLEDVWRATRGPARNFFQGLIQVSVGFYHLGNNNLKGAQSQLEKAIENLAPYGECYSGMELTGLRREVLHWLDRIRNGEDLHCTIADLPKLKFRGQAP